MTAFLTFTIVMFSLVIIGKLIWLVKGVPRQRSRDLAIDVVIYGALIVWASVLLARQA